MIIGPAEQQLGLALWAIGAVTLAPFITTEEHYDFDFDGPTWEAHPFMGLIAAAAWPVIVASFPFFLCALPFVWMSDHDIGLHRIARWWNSDWSRP